MANFQFARCKADRSSSYSAGFVPRSHLSEGLPSGLGSARHRTCCRIRSRPLARHCSLARPRNVNYESLKSPIPHNAPPGHNLCFFRSYPGFNCFIIQGFWSLIILFSPTSYVACRSSTPNTSSLIESRTYGHPSSLLYFSKSNPLAQPV